MKTSSIATVAVTVSLLMTASASAQFRGRGGPLPFGIFGGPFDDSLAPSVAPTPGQPPLGTQGLGQRVVIPQQQTPQRAVTPSPLPRRIDNPVVAQSAPVTAVALTQLDMTWIPRLSSDGVLKVQQLLKDKGFDPGAPDGVAGPMTNAAIREFQRVYGINAQGELNNQTLFALGAVDLAGAAN